MAPTLKIGPVKLEWRLDETDPRWQEFLTLYRLHFHEGRGQLVIEADIATSGGAPARPVLPNSFIRVRKLRGRDFTLGDDLVRGTSSGQDVIRCTLHPVLLAGCGLRVLEQFFYLLFYHVVLGGAAAADRCPFLLHSSGVLHQGRVSVFCGPSGSGKSTAAQLCPVRPLLNDEALVFMASAGGMTVDSTPINPFCRESTPGGGRLAGLYLIEHGPDHALLPVARAEAVPRLTAEIIAPLGLYEQNLAVGMTRALDRALLLYATGAVRRLRFRPDPGFWDLLTQEAAAASGLPAKG